MKPNCRCLQQIASCPSECPVSRESRLHERTCATCGKNPEAKRGDVLVRIREV
jgi:hypothetical protein